MSSQETKTTVLVVDDEAPMRKLIAAMLEPAGYNTIEASSGDQALVQCHQHEVDIIVTDLVMAGLNGIDLILALKKEHSQIPIIAISGGGGISGRFDYLEISSLLGAKFVLKKPFDKEQLLNLLNQVIPAGSC